MSNFYMGSTFKFVFYLAFALYTCVFQVEAQLPPHSYPNDMAWSPNGLNIAVSGPGYLLVKDAVTTNTILDLPIGENDVYNLAWSPDGQKLISSAEPQIIRVWNIATPGHTPGELLATIGPSDIRSVIAYVGWSPDGQYITISYSLANGIDLWDANTYQLVKVIPGGGNTFAWNPNPSMNQIASGFFSEEGPSIVTLTDPPVVIKPVGGRDIPAMKMVWSPDGTKLAIAYADGPTIIWDVATNTQISTISSGDDGSERSISWSPNNQTIAVASGKGMVSVWNVNTGTLISSTPPLTGVVAALSPDGKQLAYGWENGVIQIIPTPQTPQSNGTGLRGQYFDDHLLTASTLKFFRINNTIDFNWGTGSPDSVIAADTFSVRWTGKVEPLYTETYTFYVGANDGMRLWVNNQQIITDAVGWINRTTEAEVASIPITLSAGVKYDIKLEYYENTGSASVHLLWSSPSQAKQVIPAIQLYPPEGQLVFNGETSGMGEIFVMNLDGSGEVNLSNHATNDFDPIWSPDGTKVAFVSTRDGNQELYLVDLTDPTLTPRRLTNHASADNSPAWSPDGKKIAFISARTGNGDLYIIDVTGTGIPTATLRYNSVNGEDHPMWSPNGAWIAYQYYVSSTYGPEIYIIPSTGTSGPTRLTTRGGIDAAPFWSPDGSKIAFRAPDATADQIWIVNISTKVLTKLTSLGNNHFQSWSPDGSKILFQSSRDGTNEPYIMNPDGSQQTRVTPGAVSYSVWSADGRQIAFIRTGWDLYIVNRDGTDLRQLTNTPTRREKEIVGWQSVQVK